MARFGKPRSSLPPGPRPSGQRPRGRTPQAGRRPEQGGRGVWLYGRHPVLAALANPRRQVSRLLVTQAFLERHGEDLRDRRPPETVDNDMLERILGPEAAHQGIAALARPLEPAAVDELIDRAAGMDTSALVVLDEVTDPRNVGAVLRSAAAFGAAGLIVTRHNAAQETGALAKAAAGALDRVPIAEATNLRRAIEQLKEAGFWCLGLDHPAPAPLGREAPPARTAWILGAEGRGLRQLTARSCDALVEIPIMAAMESLNVSNAAAIALYEWARHHGAARTSADSDC